MAVLQALLKDFNICGQQILLCRYDSNTRRLDLHLASSVATASDITPPRTHIDPFPLRSLLEYKEMARTRFLYNIHCGDVVLVTAGLSLDF
jgi:hypothetical protein